MNDRVSEPLDRRDFTLGLQNVADSVRIVAGFEVAAISVLRANRRFEYVVVSAAREDASEFLGRGNSLAVIQQQNRNAVAWGRFDFVPHDAQQDIAGEATWIPDVTYPERDDAFHPDDLLSTLLRDRTGEIIGMLSLDIPINGRRPDARQLALMEAFADHTERVLRQVLEQQALAARLHLADTARDVVRRASASRPLDELLADCTPALIAGFDLRGLWVHVFPEGSLDGSSHVATVADKEIVIPPHLAALAETAARAAWRTQSVVALDATTPLRLLTEDQRVEVIDFLASLNVCAMLFVPLGAGDQVLGNLVLTRSDDTHPWSEAERATALELGRDLGQALRNAQILEHNRQLIAQLQDWVHYRRTFVDMMVHELKNPLTAITGHVEMARAVDGLPTMLGESLGAIERGADRLRELVGNLLTLSRVSERDGDTLHTPVDIGDLVRGHLDLLIPTARARGVVVTSELTTRAGQSVVVGDAETLPLVVSNLVSNAVAYTPPGGRVNVTVVPDGREWVVLRVSDTGLGIAEQDHEQIFEEFGRSSNPEAVAQPGTGLGLTIVKQVVEQHHGRISLDSRLGAGSTFEVRLPVGQVAQQ